VIANTGVDDPYGQPAAGSERRVAVEPAQHVRLAQIDRA